MMSQSLTIVAQEGSRAGVRGVVSFRADRHWLLVISALQLAIGVTGQFVAIRQGRSFEIFRRHGSPDRVAQETWFMGTGLSAPVDMMAVHAAAIAVLVARPSRRAARTLCGLGAAMAAGYLIENKFRARCGGPAKISSSPLSVERESSSPQPWRSSVRSRRGARNSHNVSGSTPPA